MERLEIIGAEMDSAPTQYKYNRKSLRLKHYDYSREGYYFITVTTQNREHLFGEIVDGVMVLNVAGEMINELWCDIPNDFNHVVLHDFVIMPNHIHGIIEIIKHDKPVGADMESKQRADMESAPTLSTILQSFKRHTTLRYIQMVKNNTLPPFQKRIWQRNFYEHVIRDEKDYMRIAEYIQNNETTWENDTLNNP